ncbi:hypothetical protein HYC85_021726 [Camellia sinensis]|uniref:Small nuclear ribonucleoprotein G n=1 Tax=Camellia sinensis TaxID=4442 RepID=A0A7J7GIE8_CAMSI|nr:hypothetical protein HYC85_021726 [Camellia sinensis]
MKLGTHDRLGTRDLWEKMRLESGSRKVVILDLLTLVFSLLVNSEDKLYVDYSMWIRALGIAKLSLMQSNVKLNANRMVVGTLRGFDQFMNLVVDNTVEMNGNEKADIGMVVIRGNSVVTVEALEPVSRAQ